MLFQDWMICEIIDIPMGSDPALFFANLLLYFYKSKRVKKIKKNILIKTSRLCNIFRFLDDLNSVMVAVRLASMPNGKKNTEFSRLNIAPLTQLTQGDNIHHLIYFLGPHSTNVIYYHNQQYCICQSIVCRTRKKISTDCNQSRLLLL